jgi:hypothetical protein
MRVLLLWLVAISACAPPIECPAERAQRADRASALVLDAQVANLPGVVSAHAAVVRAFADPLTGTSRPALASALILVDDRAERGQIERIATELVHAMVPEVSQPVIAIVVAAHRLELAHVGPFTIEVGSKRMLEAVLIAGLAVLALGAAVIAWLARPRT